MTTQTAIPITLVSDTPRPATTIGSRAVLAIALVVSCATAHATVTVSAVAESCTPVEVALAWNPASEFNLVWGGDGCLKYSTNWVFNALVAATTPPTSSAVDTRIAFTNNAGFDSGRYFA